MAIDVLPLVLAGPILRRVTAESVTVWIALHSQSTVRLEILNDDLSIRFSSPDTVTRPIGVNLHLLAITATASGAARLVAGQMYYYQLRLDGRLFDEEGILSLPGGASGNEVMKKIAYKPPTGRRWRPGFSLPPASLNQLRIVHGSCRRPHAPGLDALQTLDEVFLDRFAHDPIQRPHQLFLTGDQIYADDVADALLYMVTNWGRVLLATDERINHEASLSVPINNLKPGSRQEVVRIFGGLTTTDGRSHLLGFGEFLAMYLMVWSPEMWPTVLPPKEDVYGLPVARKSAAFYAEQAAPLLAFRRSLGNVRRALANIPTYMMLDDHEITDDWYINRAWAERTFEKPLALSLMRNGLLAYMLCQHWGNVPDHFIRASGGGGDVLLESARKWIVQDKMSLSSPSLVEISRLLPIPRQPVTPQDSDAAIDHQQDVIDLNFRISWPTHDLVVLDLRTRRSYPATHRLVASLIKKASLDDQIGALGPASNDKVVLVVSPAPLLDPYIVERLKEFALDIMKMIPLFLSYEDAINLLDMEFPRVDPRVFYGILERLAAGTSASHHRLVIFLSGDVHYGFAGSLEYWTPSDGSTTTSSGGFVLAQLTASPFKYHHDEAQRFHDMGYRWRNRTPGSPFASLPPPMIDVVWKLASASSSRLLPVGKESPIATDILAEVDAVDKVWATFRTLGVPLHGALTRRPTALLRSTFVESARERITPFQLEVVNLTALPPDTTRRERLEQAIRGNRNHAKVTRGYTSGKQIVAFNHIAMVTFSGFESGDPEENKAVTQEIWWWHSDKHGDLYKAEELAEHDPAKNVLAGPLTRLRVPLGRTTQPDWTRPR